MNILITGGASGLGKSIAEILAKDGSDRLFFTFSQSAQSAAKIESEFSNCSAIKCDFGNPESVAALVEAMENMDLDVLINNAYSGDFLKSHFHKISTPDFLTDFNINVLPVIAITGKAITHFRKKKSGKIITVLTAGLSGTPPIGAAVYLGGKAYLAQLSKIWAHENARFNITSNTVSPSFMQTGLTADFDERIIEQMIADHPLKKLLTTTEVAETIMFLTKASSQINGVDILLNAGLGLK